MKRKRTRLFLVMSIAWMSFYIAAFATAAEHEHTLKVGKTGELQFQSEVRVGDLTLKPGRYSFQHRVDGSEHFVHFTEWTKTLRPGMHGDVKGYPGEVTCRLEPLSKKASQTAVSLAEVDGALRVTRIVVAGENVAHVF